MSSLNRHLAPLSEAAWQQIDEQARDTLKVLLAGRKVVDFAGPHGWDFSAISTGRVEDLSESSAGVQLRKRLIQPLMELRRPFQVARSETDAMDRGAFDADLDPVRDAAQAVAYAEDGAVFGGLEAAGITGILTSSEHETLSISEDYENYPSTVAEALGMLRRAGVDGPYAIALGPRCYAGLLDTVSHGFPVMRHVEQLIGGPIISAPAIDGAVVLSMRGGDFAFTSGRDFCIGYLDHDASFVRLYIEESFAFRVLGPEAAVPLAYGRGRQTGSVSRQGR